MSVSIEGSTLFHLS